MRRSDPEIASSYASSARYVITDKGRHAFPAPTEVPGLMGDFAAWLRAAPAAPETAFSAHRRLVDSHPFNDGNGRTARLLMNLILDQERLSADRNSSRRPPRLSPGLARIAGAARSRSVRASALRASRRDPDGVFERPARGASPTRRHPNARARRAGRRRLNAHQTTFRAMRVAKDVASASFPTIAIKADVSRAITPASQIRRKGRRGWGRAIRSVRARAPISSERIDWPRPLRG